MRQGSCSVNGFRCGLILIWLRLDRIHHGQQGPLSLPGPPGSSLHIDINIVQYRPVLIPLRLLIPPAWAMGWMTALASHPVSAGWPRGEGIGLAGHGSCLGQSVPLAHTLPLHISSRLPLTRESAESPCSLVLHMKPFSTGGREDRLSLYHAFLCESPGEPSVNQKRRRVELTDFRLADTR